MPQALDAPLFADEPTPKPKFTKSEEAVWLVLIVDDEEAVHTITEMALKHVRILDRNILLLHAYTAAQARTIMANEEDIAVVLLDVVMETENAGLLLADYIREELDNHRTRIILRTGQPGHAPEREVIERYDINDYKEKTELTSRKLYSAVYTAMRSYRDIVALERHRVGLEKVINATANIFERKSMETLAQGVLEQSAALLYMDEPIVLAELTGAVAENSDGRLNVLADTHNRYGREHGADELDESLREQITEALEKKTDVLNADHYVQYIANNNGVETVLCMTGKKPFNEVDQHLISLFCRNVAIAFDNLRLNETFKQTQKEIVYSLCELAETRSKETGNHVRRVAHYSLLMAKELYLDADQCNEVFLAAPLHDVGKIGIPDAVLNKPGKLDAEEWEIMKTHAMLGAQILEHSHQPVMKAGAIIAAQHHENWDGSGYPKGLAGTDIHIYGRIVALADVFDALGSNRCYKNAWEMEEIDDFIQQQSGIKFDPTLVKIYQKRRAHFVDILEQFKDK